LYKTKNMGNTIVVNLDKAFLPLHHKGYDELDYSLNRFSGGEINLKFKLDTKFTSKPKVIITHRITNSDGLMTILIAQDALKIEGFTEFELIIPYIPYARQDRKCDKGESFSLKIFTSILNNAYFDKVTVLDSHSDVAPALIDNCVNIDNSEYVEKTLNHIGKKMVLISPDAGSNKKANKLANKLHDKFTRLVKCDKVRDLKTGQLTGFEVFADDLNGEDCIIVDDICDGGGTFLGLAEILKQKNCGDLYLFTSHGIYSRGFDQLNKTFKGIYTTNSFKDISNIGVTQINLNM